MSRMSLNRKLWLALALVWIGLLGVGAWSAYETRATMLEVADQDFVKTARAKGVPEGQVVRRHVLRNALLPVITFAGIQAGQLIGGAILVETVFAWPGLGRYLTTALLAADMNAVLGGTLVVGAVFVGLNLLSDALYKLMDPRAR